MSGPRSADALWPEGWLVEAGDPSVGIFGWTLVHDGCAVEGADDYEADTEEAVTGRRVTSRGEEILTVTTTATCRACLTVITVTDEQSNGPAEDYDHHYDDGTYA